MQDEVVRQNETETLAERGPGRPPVITLPVVEKVARLIAKGMTEEQACTRLGVNHSSLRTARHRNPEFETAIKRAQAEYLDESLDTIGKGTRGWQGRAWILERRHGEQFRRTTGMEVNAQVGPFSAVDLLARKPLAHWTKADVDMSLGCWLLLRRLSEEQLEQMSARYHQAWGPIDQWTDEQLSWGIEVSRRVRQLADGAEDSKLAALAAEVDSLKSAARLES